MVEDGQIDRRSQTSAAQGSTLDSWLKQTIDQSPKPGEAEWQDFVGVGSIPRILSDDEKDPAPIERSTDEGKQASCGDDGLTSTSNALGHLSLVTRQLSFQNSCFWALHASRSSSSSESEWMRAWRPSEPAQAFGLGFGLMTDQPGMDKYKEAESQPSRLSFVKDRWPRFTTSDKSGSDLRIIVQHVIADDTVFVVTRYEPLGDEPIKIIPKTGLSFFPNLFTIESMGVSSGTKPHSTRLGPNGYSIVMYHASESEQYNAEKKIPNETNQGRDDVDDMAVASVVSLSVNGEIRELEYSSGSLKKDLLDDLVSVWSSSDDSTSQQEPERQIRMVPRDCEMDGISTCKKEPLELIEAFQLKAVSRNTTWHELSISHRSFRRIPSVLEQTDYSELTLCRDGQLNFIMRRTLEHILSVCSTPIKVNRSTEEAKANGPAHSTSGVSGNSFEGENNPPRATEMPTASIPAGAITCGPLAAHVVSTESSFFAVEFLLAMWRRLGEIEGLSVDERSKTMTVLARSLRQRISAVCAGQAIWIKHAECDERYGHGPRYQASGNIWPETDQELSRTLKYTALHIITLIHIRDTFHPVEKTRTESLWDDLCWIIRPWLLRLDAANVGEFYAFPCSPDDKKMTGPREFRLEDHVWIWRALRAIEEVGLGHVLRRSRSSATRGMTNSKTTVKLQLARDYTSTEFQQRVLRRFTVRISGQRMLALARSSGEHKFLLGNNDVSLFWDDATSFLAGSDNAWTATLGIQHLFEENDDSSWGHSLRYGLALAMSRLNARINHRDAGAMKAEALSVVFRASSTSGITPGHLDADTKDPNPSVYEDWVSFELAHAIWTFRPETHVKDRRLSIGVIDVISDVQKISNNVAPAAQFKSTMPTNALIDTESICEIQDEWLYGVPDFVNFSPRLPLELTETYLRMYRLVYSFGPLRPRFVRKGMGHQLNITSSTTLDLRSDKPCRCTNQSDGFDCKQFRSNFVFDVSKKVKWTMEAKPASEQEGKDTISPICGIALKGHLQAPRIAHNAKKRLIWLRKPTPKLALLCYLSTPATDRPILGTFFDRYKQRDKFFSDQAAATSNLWMTELHLSFYRLGDQLTMGTAHEAEQSLTAGEWMSFLNDDQRMVKVSLGFVFVGDFFDRYWTCHVVGEGGLSDSALRYQSEFSLPRLVGIDKRNHIEKDKKPWRQRKVLELALFDLILEEIIQSYRILFDKTDRQLHKMLGQVRTSRNISTILSVSSIFSKEIDSRTYSAARKQWPTFQYTLQVMEEDLLETLEKIRLWKDREEARKPETPRWTGNDERKYRSTIAKMSSSNDQRIREIETLLSSLRSLKSALNSRLESTRDNLSFENAENIRHFTYVTIFFLPLGFATGIFSMNGIPQTVTIASMTVASIVALLVTIIFILLTKTYLEPASDLGGRLYRRARAKLPKTSRPESEEADSEDEQENSLNTLLQDFSGPFSGTEDDSDSSTDTSNEGEREIPTSNGASRTKEHQGTRADTGVSVQEGDERGFVTQNRWLERINCRSVWQGRRISPDVRIANSAQPSHSGDSQLRLEEGLGNT